MAPMMRLLKLLFVILQVLSLVIVASSFSSSSHSSSSSPGGGGGSFSSSSSSGQNGQRGSSQVGTLGPIQCTNNRCTNRSQGEHLASRALSTIKRMISDAASSLNKKLQGEDKLHTGNKKNNSPATGGGGSSRPNIASQVITSRTGLQSSTNRPLFRGQVSTKRPNKETVLLGEDERSIIAVPLATNKPRQSQSTGNSGGNNAVVIGLPDSAGSGTFVSTSPKPIFKNSVATSKPNSETLLVGEKEKPASPQPISSKRNQGTSSNGETVIRGLPESAVRIERTTSTLRPLFRPGTSTIKPNKETFLVGETERPVSKG